MRTFERYLHFKYKVMGLCHTLDRLDLVDREDMVAMREERPKDFFSRFLMGRVKRIQENND